MRVITLTGAGLLMVLSAFSIKHHSKSSQSPLLYDTKWYLTTIHSSSSINNINGKTIFIKFNRSTNSAGGKGGCNSFGSTIAVNNNDLDFRDIFSTKMYCEGMQTTEDTFLKDLQEVNRFEIKDKSLFLYHDGIVLLEFNKQ